MVVEKYLGKVIFLAKPLSKKHWVVKRNSLNEMRPGNMSLQELRLFSVYLSRINPKDKDTRRVTFKIDELHEIIGTDHNNYRWSYYEEIANRMLSHKVRIPLKHGGFIMFQLFSKALLVHSPDDMETTFSLDAYEDAMPLLFDIQKNYFRYRLWNALSLKSSNQHRLYEILKQYEPVGHRIISVVDLREMLGIHEDEYPKYSIFRRDVLEVCLDAISEKTDITCTYEPYGKKGPRGKIIHLKFTISKNKDYKDLLALDKFVDLSNDDDLDTDAPLDLNDVNSDDTFELVESGTITKKDELLIFLRDAVNREFTIEQMTVLYDIVTCEMPDLIGSDKQIRLYNHFKAKYNYVNEVASRKGIDKSKFGYLKKVIGLPL